MRKLSLSLLAIVGKYGVRISEWSGLYFALLEVSMNKIALWKNVHVDDWIAESMIIASNVSTVNEAVPPRSGESKSNGGYTCILQKEQ